MNLKAALFCSMGVYVMATPGLAQNAEDPALAAAQEVEQTAQQIQQDAEQSAFQAGQQAEQSALDAGQKAEQAALQAGQDATGEAMQDANAAVLRSTQSGSGYSHTESHSESSSTTVSVGDRSDDMRDWPDDDRSPPPWGRRPAIATRDLPGMWTLGQDGGTSCTITLQDDKWFNGYRALVPAGCPDGFFFVNNWLLVGNELQLIISDKVIGRFQSVAPDRWVGRRDSDGARMYLNRR